MTSKRKRDQVGNDEEQPAESVLRSSWLGRFLIQKREVTVLPPPEVLPIDDTYIRQFCRQFDSGGGSDPSFEHSDDDTCSASIVSPCLLAIATPESRLLNDTERSDDVPTERNGQLKFYNLPYNLDANAISATGLKYGFTFVKVILEICKSTSNPTGAARIELSPGVDGSSAAQTLQGVDFGGRPVRVQTDDQRKRRGSAGRSDSRYFAEDDNDAKCKRCGQRGHSAKNCSERCNPCHLCAGRDHEAGDSKDFRPLIPVYN